MTRIKIKCKPNSREQKLKLIEILCSKDIEISRIFETYDGFAVLTLNEHHADCIFQSDVKHDLESHGFNAFMPPKIKVKKSVIIPRVDELVYEKDTVDIGEELQKQKTWIGDEIASIYKFPTSQ